MLKLICGEAGTGKSTLLREKIKEAAVSGKKAVLFVPDQFSFEAEKIMYKTVPHEFSRNSRVTMFSREAQRILHLYGETKQYADTIAKHIVMKRALEESASGGELLYYRGQAAKRGFPAFALGMISDMRGAGISPADLRSRLAAENVFSDRLTDKLNDISVIYSAYDRILTENFDDKLDDVRRAAEIILQSDIFDGCHVFFDEFDSFSGNQLGFIRALLDKAACVTIALTCDMPDGNAPEFGAVRTLAQKLMGAADGEHEIIKCGTVYRKCGSLRVVEARDVWQECDWICAQIKALTDSGVRCRDIAVLAPLMSYNAVMDSAMKKYGIPAFADVPEPLITKSFVRFAVYTLKALSFSTDDILRYVKSGYVRHSNGKVISNIQSDMLEKLCRTYDLRKRDWLRPFPEKLDETGELEALRKSIVEPLKELRKSLENADGAEVTKLLCDHICNKMDMYKTIYGKCILDRDEKGNIIVDRRRLDEYSTLWDDTLTVFESAYKALAGYRLPLDEYIGILTDIFTSTTVANPPQVLDAVTVGDTDRSRFAGKKHIFVCGFAQGIMPPPAKSSEVFTPAESEQLSRAGIPITTDRLMRRSAELFTVYRCTHLPEESLYITYPLLGEDGSSFAPAAALVGIKERFGARTEGADNFGAEFYCRTAESAERYLARIYRDPAKLSERKALLAAVPEEYRHMLRFAAGDISGSDRHIIDKQRAGKLLRLESYSPTAITQVNRCKFAFFCKYGLGLREDGERGIDALLVGNVIHFCLQRLLTDYTDKKDEFLKLTDGDIAEHVSESVDIYEKENYFGGFGGAERFSYLLKRLGVYAERAAQRIRDDAVSSGFYPEALEKRLGFDFGRIRVSGVCDRIDSMVRDGKKYIRVVDYKRGSRTFDLADIYKGENLQMLLYLFGICGDGSVPSSVMYLPVGKVSFESSGGGDIGEKSQKSLQNYMREHSPAGLILSDSPEKEDIDALNSALTAKYGKVRGGYASSTEISPEVYEALKGYCKSYVNAKAEEAASGMAGACPEDGDVCKYCEYSLFCGKKE